MQAYLTVARWFAESRVSGIMKFEIRSASAYSASLMKWFASGKARSRATLGPTPGALIDLTHETVRDWWNRVGLTFGAETR